MIPDEVPLSHPCPCGNGEAEIRPTPTTEPNPKDSTQRITTYHYRHSGCPIGGSAVLIDGDLHRLIGPLFNPRKFDVHATQVRHEPSTVAADGGTTLEEGSE